MTVLTLVLCTLGVVFGLKNVEDFQLVAHLKQHRLADFEKLYWQIATPNSPEYLKFRSPEEIGAMIGATDDEIASVSNWMLASGGANVHVSPMRDMVTATFLSEAHSLTLTDKGLPRQTSHPSAIDFILRRDVLVEADEPTSSSRKRRMAADDDVTATYTISNIKNAYGMPTTLQASNDATEQMVWGPGTFGYSTYELAQHKATQCPLLNMDKVVFDTANHGQFGGDNFYEGQLDVDMIASFGLNVKTLVSNTNTSASTEESTGFGGALLDFLTSLAQRASVPQVLSMSLGSLSAASCDLLCSEVESFGYTAKQCWDYMATQRQVCMYLSQTQTDHISTAMQVLGVRGVTILGSSGDGGSHFSFGKFSGGKIADALNSVSCAYQIPVYPTASPYILSIGGEMWGKSSADPIVWSGYGGGSGGGFSIQFPAPDHQKAMVSKYLNSGASGLPPKSSYNASNRAYPDVSAVGVQGTSQSCPILAGMISMIIDQRLNAGLGPLGALGPRLYEVAGKYPGKVFQDITSGNSNTSCANGFPATVGWDANTGVGRPIWSGLVKYFASDDYLSEL